MKRKINFGTLLIMFFMISCCIDFFGLFQEAEINIIDMLKYFLHSFPAREEIMIIITGTIITLVANTFKFFFLFGIYFIIKLVNKKLKKEKLSEVDLKKYDGYFRDVLKGYNPVELSYIDDFTIDNPKDYVAMLLNLKGRGVIDFDELNDSIIIKNRDKSLSRLDDYFLNNIVDGKFKRFSSISISNIVQKEALKKGILKENTKDINWKKAFIVIIFLVFFFWMIINLFFKIDFAIINENLLTFIVIVFFITLFCFATLLYFAPLYMIVYFIKSFRHPYVRSEQGEELNKRLEGLKNYLKDFSYMDERNAEELIIWEDYLVYSVLFNQNSKIVDEVVDKYFEK